MLKIENIAKSYGSKKVLQGLNLNVADGSVFGLVGVNGAGKSTLLRCIAGVYQSDEGTITLDDHSTWSDPSIRQKIAFVSDEQYCPVGASLRTMHDFYAAHYSFDEAAYQKYLSIFELEDDMRLNSMSKGMKRRSALLSALCIHPSLILLDEAYDGLEPIARLRFKQALADLVAEENVTVIISSHNLRELEDICDSYGILQDGKMLTYGDLLTSRENVNKYQLAFPDEKTQADFKDFDVLHFEKEGRVIQLVIRGDREKTEQKLNALHPLVMDVLPATFEELFIYEIESTGERHE